MLSRFIAKPSHFRLLTRISSSKQPNTFSHSPQNPNLAPTLLELSRYFSSSSSNRNGDNDDQSTTGAWKFSRENDGKSDPFGDLAGFTDFDGGELKAAEGRGNDDHEEAWTRKRGEDGGDIFKGIDTAPAAKSSGGGGSDDWLTGDRGEHGGGDIFEGIDAESAAKSGGGVDDWLTGEGEFKPWNLADEEKANDDIFGIRDAGVQELRDEMGEKNEEVERREEMKKLEMEENALTAVLKGPHRAFGDLIAASGITDKMLDSLIALKDLDEVDGLPPLTVIEDMRYEKNTRKSTRAEIERQKQEEIAKARVRQVDDQGRAYGTGRRKCSIARVWIQPGEGKFVVNDKEFDVYFPMLDHRAALLRPFSETKTLGLWDIDCTVKGGGVSGQVGAIRLGISRALQNWEPGLRPALKEVGFLTRDPRVVERKKPGKAKARKSFQWVKR